MIEAGVDILLNRADMFLRVAAAHNGVGDIFFAHGFDRLLKVFGGRGVDWPKRESNL
jgi:hypothetical protein